MLVSLTAGIVVMCVGAVLLIAAIILIIYLCTVK